MRKPIHFCKDENYSHGLAEAELNALSPQAQVKGGGRGEAV